MKKFILSIFLLLISAFSFATEVKYVGVNSASIREYATDSTPIIGKISYGKKVYVHDTLNGWSRLTDVKETKQRWVSSSELCNTPNCNPKHNKTANNAKKAITQAPKANKAKKPVSANNSTKVTKKRKIYYSSGCPCGYGYCYGPRGGRYCITSGGNKSYK